MNVPKLRFKEFDGEWEEKDIIHIAQDEKSAVKIGPFGSQLRKEYLQSAGLYKVYGQENVFNNDFSQGNRFLNEERFNLLKSSEIISGDIVISMMGTIGKIAEVPSNIQVGIMDSHLIRIRLDNQKYLNSFFIQVMNSTILKKQIEKLSVGSIMSGLSSKVIKILQFPYTKIEEQKKISKFLNLLDKKIQLQQQKIDLLQEQKKGYMQKIFNQGLFQGEWEEVLLGNIVDIKSGRDYKHLAEGDVPVYGTGGYMLSVNEFLSESDAVGIGRKGSIDKPQLLKAPFWTVDTLFYCIPKGEQNLDFIHLVFQNINWKKYDESTGVPSLSKNTIKNIKVLKPDLKKQKQIGEFFKNLDKEIALEQQKLELLKKQKQGFMQQMFI